MALHPRLNHDLLDPDLGIGAIGMDDMRRSPIGVMLQARAAARELESHRRTRAEMSDTLRRLVEENRHLLEELGQRN